MAISQIKGIGTLFASSTVLVGLMATGLSFPQSVSAQDISGCPEGTVEKDRGRCIGPEPTTTVTCPEGTSGPTGPENKQKCKPDDGGKPVNPIVTTTCPEPFEPQRVGGETRCVAKPGN